MHLEILDMKCLHPRQHLWPKDFIMAVESTWTTGFWWWKKSHREVREYHTAYGHVWLDVETGRTLSMFRGDTALLETLNAALERWKMRQEGIKPAYEEE